jgi:hypothetical protein
MCPPGALYLHEIRALRVWLYDQQGFEQEYIQGFMGHADRRGSTQTSSRRVYALPNSDLLPSLLFKINENQLAMEAAIMELTILAEKLGATEVGGNVRGALQTIDKNEEFIKLTLAVLSTPE